MIKQGASGEVLVICSKCGSVTFPRKLCEVQTFLERGCKKCEHGKSVQSGHRRLGGPQRVDKAAQKLAKQLGLSQSS